MQTPMLPGWKGAQFGGAFATVVKKAGRGAKTNAGNAIVVTCSGLLPLILPMRSLHRCLPCAKSRSVLAVLEIATHVHIHVATSQQVYRLIHFSHCQ